MSAAADRRVAAAENALETARQQLYASGRTPRSECLRTAMRRGEYEQRAAYLQAECHLRMARRWAGA